MRLKTVVFLCAASLVGCASYGPPPVSANHPASPDAASAPLMPTSSVLTIDKKNLPSMPQELGGGMDMTASPAGQTAPSSQPAKVLYTCPMHPEVVSDKPGRCPKCGMTLVPMKGNKDEQ